MLDYVDRLVSYALRKLASSRTQLQHMVRTKLQQQVYAVIGRYRPTGALQQAGLDAHKP
ncbi:hypothetical protein [Paracoccus sp. ME4]|uniref:hypothetical protein n=1 Tax=Paracoccus sp. ME4 TaxID=3138066 RepID=UPI00398B2211